MMKEYKNKQGQLHRVDAPAIIHSGGYKAWYLNGKLHRRNGPAVTSDSYKAWYINDKRHRIDGPARIHSDGSEEYWVNDIKITEKQFKDKKALAFLLIVG